VSLTLVKLLIEMHGGSVDRPLRISALDDNVEAADSIRCRRQAMVRGAQRAGAAGSSRSRGLLPSRISCCSTLVCPC